ncbi:NAD-dependent epimerase/dehydratase family protein [Actinotalea sp. M2MS4P-6]|uniref:NAD-dependent epimerase/dehydratase family protein n=1 Tax=Actinotalea sp. M2MS4P-6 TaxID=2983762 RepID=UPI0021E4702A|nr:NAD-dependent epimerase/dehydratase family protein [Actinotalea sp. M2MS4P-6]MCV2396005.1 NAD-dependent epimerase/dehydratase family protein [Actinotalea sp. M2MS4P-6]
MARYVVVGAGQVGTAVTRAAVERGDDVVVVTRSGSGPELEGVQRAAADAADAEALARLAAGADVLVNAANPAYHRWPVDWPPVAAALLTTAERTGAVLVTVSNLYGYGPVDGPMTEDLPLAATSVKGQVRARMWRDAKAAHDAGRVRAVELRGSDYMGPSSQNRLGDRAMKPLLAGKRVQLVGSLDQPHTWTLAADMGRMVAAVALDERAWGRAWHVPSVEPRTQRESMADLAAAAGVPLRLGSIPYPLLWSAGLAVPTIREVREVLYQFTEPFVMDSTAAQATFGLAPTPWEHQVADQVAAYRD